MAPRRLPAVWIWATPDAARVLKSRDLAAILRVYRRVNQLSQEQLADLLGYDKTYISMIETGRRTVNDVGSRRHIARTLAIPAHVLGVTEDDDTDFAAMLQFGDSLIRLSDNARKAGCAVDAVNELWPLVARLEARVAEGHLERDILLMLGRARVAFGVSLGTVLPEEQLSTAALWTGKALRLAERLGDRALLAHALRMHGNELRKANHTSAAISRLARAVGHSCDPGSRGVAYALLARAAGEHGNTNLFDHALERLRRLLDSGVADAMLVNPFSFREILLRGLMATGRTIDAVRIMEGEPNDSRPAAPQWYIIERVTAGEVLLAAGLRDAAEDALHDAITGAESQRLPHQLQRGIRASDAGRLLHLREEGRAALRRLCDRRAARSRLNRGFADMPDLTPAG